MSAEEWWWVFDAKRTDKVPGSSLSEEDLADLYELIS
jgi:hypothetical protein